MFVSSAVVFRFVDNNNAIDAHELKVLFLLFFSLCFLALPYVVLRLARFWNMVFVLVFSLFQVAMRALGFDVKKPDIIKIMQDYDRNNTGLISFDDFMDLMTQKMAERDPDQEILKAFRLFDDENTGKITVRQLKRVAKELGENLTDEELEAMITEFDTDGDGASMPLDLHLFFFSCISVSAAGFSSG